MAGCWRFVTRISCGSNVWISKILRRKNMSEGVLTDSQPRTEAQARALKIAREELDKVGLTDVVVRLARSGSSFDNRFFYVAKSRVNRSETDVRMTIQRDVADLLCQLERPEEALKIYE